MNKHRGHIPLLIMALFVTGAVVFAYAYVSQSLWASAKRVVLARGVVRSEENGKSREKDLADLYQSTVDDRARIASVFIQADDVVVFIEALEALGPQTGSIVSISSISADKLDGAAPGKMGLVKAHVDATGSWSSALRLISLAEMLPYKTVVDRLRLDTSAGADAKREWKASFDIQAAIIVPPKPASP